jgi:hypothetical protein
MVSSQRSIKNRRTQVFLTSISKPFNDLDAAEAGFHHAESDTKDRAGLGARELNLRINSYAKFGE